MTWSLLDIQNRNDHTKATAFLDAAGGGTIQRYDIMKYPVFDRYTEKTLSFFWRPDEINLMKDAADFKTMSQVERDIFTNVLRRQIVLDTLQSMGPNLAFLPIASLPEMEAWIQTWAFSELIHSRSYTHIIRNVYPNPSLIFDGILDIPEITSCATDITHYYDELIRLSSLYRLFGEGTHTVNGKTVEVSLYELKKALWLTIMGVNVLEGIRFYASFAVTFAFAESNRLLGASKIMKLITRDENLHLGSTQTMLKILIDDDADFKKISEETKEQCSKMFRDAAEQEKDWTKFIFQNGSIIGLNTEILSEYVEWICNKRLAGAGLPAIYKVKTNPLPWMKKWIAGSEVQARPQEEEITSYTLSEIKQDVGNDTFKGFSL